VKTGGPDPDEVPEPSEEPYVTTGELGTLGEHRQGYHRRMPAKVARGRREPRPPDAPTGTVINLDPLASRLIPG